MTALHIAGPDLNRLFRRRWACWCGVAVLFCAVLAAPAQIVINEIMFHASSHNPREEYVELLNTAATNVNLSGWQFTQGIHFAFPSNTVLGASKFLVVVANRPAFTNKYPAITNFTGDFLLVRITNVVGFNYTNFENSFSNTRDTLKLEDALGHTIDSVSYADEGDWAVRQRGLPDRGYQGWTWLDPADGLGKSLELINPNLLNDSGQNWAASAAVNGTPGAANSVASTNIAPLILETAHSPIVPLSTDTVAITARILDETNGVTGRLFWRVSSVSPPAFTGVAMSDDGVHGDGTAGDGIYGALIPPQANGTIVEFYVEAVDVLNKTNTWPRPAVDTDGVTLMNRSNFSVNALYQVDNAGPTNSAPYYKLVMTPLEYNEFSTLLAGSVTSSSPDSDAAFNCTFISLDPQGTEVRYRGSVRNRGHGSRYGNPHNYRVDFPSDSTWKGVTGLNLNARTVQAQHFGAALAQRSGVAGNNSRAVQWRVNGGAGPGGTPTLTYYAANEAVDSDFAANHFPTDSGGNLYSVIRDLSPPNLTYRTVSAYPNGNYLNTYDGTIRPFINFGPEDARTYTNTYFKDSNGGEYEFTDIIALSRILGASDLFTTANVRSVINVEQWLTHLAVMAIVDNKETGLNSGYNDDYGIYRGVNDPRCVLLYHDLDTIMNSGGSTSASLFGSTNNNGVGPAMHQFLRAPAFEPLYYQTVQRLLNTSFTKTNFDALAAQTLGFYVPVATINAIKTWMDTRRGVVQGLLNSYFAANPPPPTATVSGEPRSPTPFSTATLAVGGSNVFSYKFKLNNGAYSVETAVATPITLSSLVNGSTNFVSVIGKSSAGAWQDTNSATASKIWVVNTATPAVRLNEVLADNATAVNHAGTFPDLIELYNEGGASVDLGGFHLSDDPANPAKYTFPAPTVLAAGTYLVVYANNNDGSGGLHTGFTLSADGEGVYLFNAANTLLDSVTFGLQLTDLSVGRFGTSGDWKLCTPSAGVTNVVKPTGALANVRINEWLADGVPPFVEDFVELYNPNAAPVDLGRCYFTDEPNGNPTLQQLPPLTFIAANGYLSLTADGKNDPRHLNFNLSADQEQVALLDPTLTTVDWIVFGPQRPGISQGRCADGANNYVFLAAPTPGAPNACPSAAATGLLLNEVLADNRTRLEADGSAPDWVELFNTSTNTLNLADLSLSDDVANPRQFVFAASQTMAPLTHKRVLFDSDQPLSATNTGFRLKSSGDSVYLFNSLAAGGGLLDSIVFGVQAADFSIGRVPNGSTNWTLCLPTPAASNTASALGDPLQLKVNEWLANPVSGDDYFEIYNPLAQPVALADYWLTDDLSTPSTRMKHKIAKLSFIGTNAFGYQKFDADNNPQNGADHVAFALASGGESLGISQPNGTLIDGVTFGAQALGVSQGRFPDGSANTNSFPASESLGAMNWLPLTSIVINEVLTHTDPPLEDAIEILNTNAASVNITGWFLGNQKSNLKKYAITNAITLPSGGFKVFYETQFNDAALSPNNFTLNSAHGDNVYLSQATNGVLTGYRAQTDFGAAENGVSFGRYRNSAGAFDFVALSARTFGVDSPATVAQFRTGAGKTNAYPLVGPVVLSEVMYQPPLLGTNDNTRDEFIELRNTTASPLPLYDVNYPTNRWRLRGAVDFDFPPGVMLTATGTLVVVGFDPVGDPATLAAFKAAYGVSGALTVLGPWSGKLGNTSESISLLKPDAVQLPPHPDAGFVPFVLVEKISYTNGLPWPTNVAATGRSLQRMSLTGYGNDSTNWSGANPTLVISANGDSDGDGMPDAWENLYGFNSGNPADAALDSDGDGMTNLQEYLSGTNPLDPSSRLYLFGSPASTNRVRLQFDARSNVIYNFESRTSLSTGVWLNLVNVPAAPSNRTVTITNTANPLRFYRVTVP